MNKVIEDALEKNPNKNGHLSKTRFAEMVVEMKEDIMKGVHEKSASILSEVKKTVTDRLIEQYPNNNFAQSDSFMDEDDNTGKFLESNSLFNLNIIN